jgi:low temperature requirement protein LtrA
MGTTQQSKLVERVTPLELFFDLVFVFAVTQVTTLLAEDPTWEGLARGILVLSAVWWAWVAYAWLTNTSNPDEGGVRISMFAAMGAMLVVGIAVPHAFGDDALLFGVAYFLVLTAWFFLYSYSTRGDDDVHRAVLRLAPGVLLSPALIVAAAFLDGLAQGAVWLVALVIGFASPYLTGTSGWRVSPGHFAERHGLIVIIALGESIVAIGLAAAGAPIDAGIVVATLLGLTVAAALWWAYFDVVAIAAERRLQRATGEERSALARDSYSMLHQPMIAGIVLFALGAKKTLGHVGDPLDTIPAVALGGGVALYLLGHIGFRLRNMGSLNRQRLVAAVLCLATIPLAREAPALVALGAVAAIVVALVAYEGIRFREARLRLRSEDRATPSLSPK